MIKYVTGDIIEDPSECLVNTVNLEGFMGKGIAYQFKLKFPGNERAYVNACRAKTIKIGSIMSFSEADKIIVNFPTKDQWRKPSEYSYIEEGLRDLQSFLTSRQIKSIAVPPLGCGNGGLEWVRVRALIEEYLKPISEVLQVTVYEPSKYYKTTPGIVPKLNASHLVLMRLKSRLDKFTKLRVQKAAYFLNLFSGSDYFRFEEHKFGPYSHSIDILSKQIKEFQDYYKVTTVEAEKLAYKNLVSESVESKVKAFEPSLLKASNFVNSLRSDLDLEIAATVLYIVGKSSDITYDAIVARFFDWPKDTHDRFSELEIRRVVDNLVVSNLLSPSLIGLELDLESIKSQKMPRYRVSEVVQQSSI